MKIAVASDAGAVSPHFGRCPEFTIVDLRDGKAKEKNIVKNPGHEPGKIPRFLKGYDVEIIIAGGIGRRAQLLFDEMNIKQIQGVTGSVESVITNYIAGTLEEGETLCTPRAGTGYGIEKTVCDHGENKN